MSEGGDWGDLENLPEPKRVVPLWLWGCGFGCLLMILLVGAGGFFAVNWFQQGMDPVAIEESLGEVIRFDELPEDFLPVFGKEVPFIDTGFYVLRKTDEQRVALFFHFPSSEDGRKAGDEMLKQEGEGQEPIELLVQGRTLRAVPVTGDVQGGFGNNGSFSTDGRGLLVELTEEGGRPLLLVYSSEKQDDEVTPEEVIEFLKPFHVGPDR